MAGQRSQEARRPDQEGIRSLPGFAVEGARHPTPFVWHKTAEEILKRLAGYCAAINQPADA